MYKKTRGSWYAILKIKPQGHFAKKKINKINKMGWGTTRCQVLEPKNCALEECKPPKMWAPSRKAGVCYKQGFFFLGVRKGSIWDSLLIKGGKQSQGSFLKKMGRGNLPRAQTTMYLWGKPSQFGCTLRKIISYVPGKRLVNVAERCKVPLLSFFSF